MLNSLKPKVVKFSIKTVLDDGARCEKCGKQTIGFDSEVGFTALAGTICGVCLSVMSAPEFIERALQKGNV